MAISPIGTVIAQMWFGFTGIRALTLFSLQDAAGNTHFSITKVNTNPTTTVRFWDANGAQVGSDLVVLPNIWLHIGVKLTVGNTGTLTVWRDDNIIINNVTGDFQNGATATVGRVVLGGLYDPDATVLDDLIIMDTTGGVQDAFLGSGAQCVAIRPTANGDTNQWTPLSGANWDNVKEVQPDGDTTYNAGAAAADLDLYNCTNLPTYTGTVLGIHIWAYARKTGGGVEQFKIALKTGGNLFYGSNAALLSTYNYFGLQQILNPDTGPAAWSQSEINALQLGAEVV
jgi:hypothetical protein